MRRTMILFAMTVMVLGIVASGSIADPNLLSPALLMPTQSDSPKDTGAEPNVAMMGGAVTSLLDADAARLGFQALFTDDLGVPLAGVTIDLSFAVYTTGAGLVVESLPTATYPMSNGVVSAQLPFSPSSFSGNGMELGVTIDGEPEMSPRIPLSAVPYAYRVDRVASMELDDDISLGDFDTSGSLAVYSGIPNALGVELDGATGQLRVHNPFGDGQIALAGNGQLIATSDDAGIVTTISGTDGISGGGACLLGTASGSIGLTLDGDGTAGGGGHIVMYNTNAAAALSLAASTATVKIGSVDPGAAAGNLHLYPANGGPSRIHLDGGNADLRLGLSGFASGNINMYSVQGGTETISLDGTTGEVSVGSNTQVGVRLDGTGGGGGGTVLLWNGAGTQTVELDGDENNAAELRLSDSSGTDSIALTAATGRIDAGSPSGGADGDVYVYSNAGHATVQLDGAAGDLKLGWPLSTSGSLFAYSSASGNPTVEIDGSAGVVSLSDTAGGMPSIELNGDIGVVSLSDTTQETFRLSASGGGGGSAISMWNSAGTATVEIDADEANHAAIRLSDSSGATAISLIAATGVTTTKTLTITGGSDLAEPFDVRHDRGAIVPGMVVSIDAQNPGELVVSDKAYDRTVAGVISGAGGVNAGMVMGQSGSIANGAHPVALTGRVYVWADASNAAIEVGDLLTTSSTAGHAARVGDYGRAQGAVIGKAMTSLESGRGLVLVLVSLQ